MVRWTGIWTDEPTNGLAYHLTEIRERIQKFVNAYSMQGRQAALRLHLRSLQFVFADGYTSDDHDSKTDEN